MIPVKKTQNPINIINKVYGRISFAFNPVIYNSGNAQNGCNIFVN